MDCIFCKIANGEIPSQFVYEDDKIVAFKDINPVAPVHILVVPKKHICCMDALDNEDKELMGELMIAISKIAKKFPELENGYRVINNCGDAAGQTVKHIHFHIIGGLELGEKLI